MQSTASPKGSWEFYCKDLIDWRLRQASSSPVTLSLAGALSLSFLSFTHTRTQKVKLGLRDPLLTAEVIKKNCKSPRLFFFFSSPLLKPISVTNNKPTEPDSNNRCAELNSPGSIHTSTAGAQTQTQTTTYISPQSLCILGF